MTSKRILIVDDDPLLRRQLIFALKNEYEILEAGDRIEAEKMLFEGRPELCLVDLNLPPSGKSQEGMKLVQLAKETQPDTVVIVMSGNEDSKHALKAVEAGAYDYFRKPFDLTELKLIVRRAMEKQRIDRENERLQKELQQKYSFQNIIGQSPGMLRVFDAVRRVADTPATVIIRGESGTGKELIARAIHYNSRRRNEPFISISCAALPETLVETELFGHERGAFTGAVAQHQGRFEQAHQGTLFLDEIGSVSPGVQAKLLRVLQEKCFERVGGSRSIQSDVRLVTATNEDLEAKVARAEFREDLFYRVHVFPIHILPLRERREDIPLLLDHFMAHFCAENKRAKKRFDSAALDALCSYQWKGNVRELENMVHTLVLMTDEITIGVNQLPSYVAGASPSAGVFPSDSGIGFDQAVGRFEQRLIESALQKTNGVKARAAEILEIDKNRMKYLCRKYKI